MVAQARCADAGRIGGAGPDAASVIDGAAQVIANTPGSWSQQ